MCTNVSSHFALHGFRIRSLLFLHPCPFHSDFVSSSSFLPLLSSLHFHSFLFIRGHPFSSFFLIVLSSSHPSPVFPLLPLFPLVPGFSSSSFPSSFGLFFPIWFSSPSSICPPTVFPSGCDCPWDVPPPPPPPQAGVTRRFPFRSHSMYSFRCIVFCQSPLGTVLWTESN